jgi:PAS domain S-box-containing protein
VFKINAKGEIVFASQQSKLLFRLGDEETMVGTYILDWIVKPDELRMLKNIHTHFKESSEPDTHFVLQRKDGSTFFGEVKNAIIYDTEGNTKGLIAVVRNITDRKQFEQRILRNTIETEERERQRFSEDLHDGLGPLLSAVKIHLELIATRMGRPMEQKEFIKMTDDLLQESIKSTREIANNLTPNLLNDFGLIEALGVYVEKINKMNTIFIDFKVSKGFPGLPKQTEVALYRVVCELINNTLKHSSASKIDINLLRIEKQIEIRYTDNGIGFDVQKMLSSGSKGLGLSNIISRVKSINGNCTFDSEPGYNFSSLISLAIADESEKEQLQHQTKA